MIIFSNSKRKKKILARRSKFGKKAKFELLLFKSNSNIYGYIVDLDSFNVLFSKSTLILKSDSDKKKSNIERSFLIGQKLRQECENRKIDPVVNIADYIYIGRVKALIDAFNGNSALIKK